MKLNFVSGKGLFWCLCAVLEKLAYSVRSTKCFKEVMIVYREVLRRSVVW